MKVGVVLPSAGPKCTPENMIEVARWARELGYHSLWVTDHVILPERVDSWYPYRSHGRWDYDPATPWMDPLLSLGWAAHAAPGLQLGTSVLVAPLRNPFLLAKQLSTLDFLSGGRVIFGIGAGWMREEFDIVGQGYDDRGRRVIEMVDLMRALWTGDSVTFHGTYYHVDDARMHPRPANGRIPIVWGGHSDHALKRVARVGDGWHPTQVSLDELRAGLAKLRGYCAECGRAYESLMIVARPGNIYTVTPEAHAAHIEMGVTHLVADTLIKDPSMDVLRKEMERIALVCGL
jgi:probable F420-dependent oxidoreductase